MIRLNLGSLRASLDLHLSLGKPDEPEDRYEDGVGTHQPATETTTGLGFTSPGPRDTEAWDRA